MGVFGLILGLLTLPPYAIYQTVLYLTSTPPTPAWSLPKHVFSSCMRYLSSCSGASANSHPKPLTDSGTRGPYPAGAFQQPKVARWTVGRGVHVAEVRVAPVGDEWKVGVARVGGHVVKSVEVPGFWVDAVQNAGAPDRLVGADERVVLYFAGGGIRPLLSPIPYALSRAVKTRIFAVSYPDAKSTGSAFPAQLLDALAGWLHVTQVSGARPENVCVMGESAGAFAALVLARYLGELKESGKKAGMPGGLALISPACNMSRLDHPIVATDFRLPHYRRHIAPALAHHFLSHPLSEPLSLKLIEDDVYLSPAISAPGSFSFLADAKTKVWVQFGAGELFADDVTKLVKRMEEDGVRVAKDVVDGGFHCQATMGLSIGRRGRAWRGIVSAFKEMGWDSEVHAVDEHAVDTK